MLLFLSGFFILFFELACIRWFPAYVVFLQFFSNTILIASFLGIALGCLSAESSSNWLRRFPRLVFFSCIAAILVFVAYTHWSAMAFGVTADGSANVVFFGVESRNVDLAKFVVPLEIVAAAFFILVSLLFIGPGQMLGRAFHLAPDKLWAYALNVSGSIAGVILFTLLCFYSVPAWIWFIVSFACITYFLFDQGTLRKIDIVYLSASVLVVGLTGTGLAKSVAIHWSPYYMVTHNIDKGTIAVDTLAHQTMESWNAVGSVYSLIHFLRRDSGGVPFKNALVIGAGSGNDVNHALKHNVGAIDAVEIDPVIQDIGRKFHPDRPYDDRRVMCWVDDGRHFLRTSKNHYDLIVYALVDSVKLASSFSNVRLENFLFTKEAFIDVKNRLSADGVFISYNVFRQGWVVYRIANMLGEIFGTDPLVLTFPVEDSIVPDGNPWQGLSIIIAGNTSAIRAAFEKYGRFLLNMQPQNNYAVNGFTFIPPEQDQNWTALHATRILEPQKPIPPATDDWPQLYMRNPNLPIRPYLSSIICLLSISLFMLYRVAPSGTSFFNGRMFFLGAGFLLIETKSIVQLALLFGNTWVVNSSVFLSILLMTLFSNLIVRLVKINTGLCYLGLFAAILLTYLTPFNIFLEGTALWRYGLSSFLVLSPVFFAGLIFSDTFSRSKNSNSDYAWNFAGAIIGAWIESLSLLVGFKGIGIVAAILYLFSALFKSPKVGAE